MRSLNRSVSRVVFRSTLLVVAVLLALSACPGRAHGADDRARADALLEEGGALYMKPDYRGAQVCWEQALAIYHTLRLEKDEANTLNLLGVVAADLAYHDKALGYLQQALAICRRLALEKETAATLNNLGNVAADLAHYEQALGYYEEALLTVRKLGLEEDEADTLLNLGNVAEDLAQYEESLGYYEHALAIYRRLGLKTGAAALNNLGILAEDLGQYEKSLGYFEQARATYHALGLEKAEADTLGNLGKVAVDLGQYDKALGYFEQALATFRKLGREERLLPAELNIADVYMGQGRLEQARAILERGEIADPLRWGRYWLLVSRPDVAAMWFEAAGELAVKPFSEQVPTRLAGPDERTLSVGAMTFSGLVASRIGLGLAHEALGESKKAAGRAQEAIAEWKTADAAYRRAVALIEEARKETPKAERETFLAAKMYGFPRVEAYEGLVRVQHRLGRDDEAFYWSEHAKARALVEALARTPYGTALGLPPDLSKQENDLRNQVEALSRRLQEKRELRSTIEPRLNDAQDQLKRLIDRLWREYPEYASMKYPQPLRASEMKSDLKPGEVLLEYEVTDPESFAFLVRAGQVKAFEIKISREELNKRIEAYRNGFEQVSARLGIGEKAALKEDVDLALSQQLYELLLKEPLGQIKQGQQVAIVPDEAIGLLPLEGLAESVPKPLIWKDGEHGPTAEGVRYVGDAGRVFTYWQSGTSMSTVRRLQRGAYGQQVLVVADPVFDEDDDRLHGTPLSQAPPRQPEGESSLAAEVRAGLSQALGLGGQGFPRLKRGRDLAEGLRAAYGDRLTAWLDLNANEGKLKKEPLSGYGEVVFFTHGVLDEEVPVLRQPALVLSLVRNEPGEDGYLTMGEVMDLKLRAEVAGLMACHSGAGRLVSGEGVMGMGRAFQYAGARSVLASLWYVNAASTNDLTEAFLRGISQGQDKAQALASAHEALRQAGYDHPYYWAPFILIGERGFAGVVKQ